MSASPIDLVLDVGNTRTKWGLFSDGRVVRNGAVPLGDMAGLRKVVGGNVLSAVAIGSVARPDSEHLSELGALGPVLVLDGKSPSPIQNKYGTPDTLGADRLANVVGAYHRFTKRPVMVIDIGTCITYDMLEADGCYVGGAITPGPRMRAKAMHTYSARLPEVEMGEAPPLLGSTTKEALEAGIHHGILGEIKEFVRTRNKESPEWAVVFTGGDALPFARAMESGIFAIPFLTLEGYHALLEHHRSLHPGGPLGDALGPDGAR